MAWFSCSVALLFFFPFLIFPFFGGTPSLILPLLRRGRKKKKEKSFPSKGGEEEKMEILPLLRRGEDMGGGGYRREKRELNSFLYFLYSLPPNGDVLNQVKHIVKHILYSPHPWRGGEINSSFYSSSPRRKEERIKSLL